MLEDIVLDVEAETDRHLTARRLRTGKVLWLSESFLPGRDNDRSIMCVTSDGHVFTSSSKVMVFKVYTRARCPMLPN